MAGGKLEGFVALELLGSSEVKYTQAKWPIGFFLCLSAEILTEVWREVLPSAFLGI